MREGGSEGREEGRDTVAYKLEINNHALQKYSLGAHQGGSSSIALPSYKLSLIGSQHVSLKKDGKD